MTRRHVTHVKKDNYGNIIGLCNKVSPKLLNEDNWYNVTTEQAISHIKSKEFAYFVRLNKHETDIHVARTSNGYEYLRTDPDDTTNNNLDELPIC